jgi:hypothetical protein
MKITTVFLDAGGVLIDEAEQELAFAGMIVDLVHSTNPTYSLSDYWQDVGKGVRCHVPNIYKFAIWQATGQRDDLYRGAVIEFKTRISVGRPPLTLMAGIADEVAKMTGIFKLGIAGQYGAEIL